jgi:pSer/pThr/pTyr-binding forkhead associated (FHA) protein
VESPIAPHTSTPIELKERLEAERAGEPFLVYRDDGGRQRICTLPSPRENVTIGRRATNSIVLDWDPEVSRLHAVIQHIGDSWTISDDNLSSNGSFVNGERLSGQHRLEDGDTILVGGTPIVFRDPGAQLEQSTAPAGSAPVRSDMSSRQQQVLIALCRPYRGDAPFAIPATNEAIADEVCLSVHAVKSHLRFLFRKFGIEHLPQNKKRAELVRLALHSGLVSERDFTARG